MKLFCALLASLIFASCSTSPRYARTSNIGVSKSAVVEEFGSPARTWRTGGRDHWYYNANSSRAEDKIILIFENGVLVEKVQPGISSKFDRLEQELEQSKSQKKKNPGKFKTLSD
ncbi:MAG TPA: hypothetical protein DCL41_06615 [Bdellovibrionales bacterium]|nr:hypothetical protein [Pseudobdellovibrionaceae bacterium]HAG91524.1 hypothetical protein [Bdellovibrionales bacterium]|tara:strand:- start:1999 stop:2343 length:345 start_codon:yes stop_codon:yes gene_type:complete